MQRYEEWMQLREIGIRKCEERSLPLPTWLKDPPPPPPEPFHDEDVGEVSAEMIQHETAEASESFNLERSLADDQVPLADPEVEGARTPMVSRDPRTRCFDGDQGAHPWTQQLHTPLNPLAPASPSSSASPHVRRKSVLPRKLRMQQACSL